MSWSGITRLEVNCRAPISDSDGREEPSCGRQPGTSSAPATVPSTKPRLHGLGSINPSLGSFGNPTGMVPRTGALRTVASWLCVPAFQRVCLCRDPHAEGCDPAVQLFGQLECRHPHCQASSHLCYSATICSGKDWQVPAEPLLKYASVFLFCRLIWQCRRAIVSQPKGGERLATVGHSPK